MATLGDLHAALFPTARPAGQRGRLRPEQAAREVGWVRVLKARVPAFDALEPGDLAVIPAAALAVVAPGPTPVRDLADALARARVPAVLLIDGDDGADAAETLAIAAAAHGLTVLRLGRLDPIALERSVIGYLVNRRAELDRRAAELESQLAALALLGRGLDALAAAIGGFTGRAVVIEGRRGDALAIHAPADQPGTAAPVARYLARPADAALRVPLAAPEDAPGAGGHLVLLGDDPPNESERIATERIAGLLALELARDTAIRQAREETRRGDALPADGPPWVVLVARQGATNGPDDRAEREATRADLRLLAPGRRLALRGSAESLEIRLVAAATADDPDGSLIAGRVAALLERPVAVSRPFGEPGGRPAAEASARAALDASDLLRPAPLVVRAERLPAYLLLGNLHNLPDGLRQARQLLAPILSGTPSARRERLDTLRAVLEAGSLGDAAASLGVHRNTIAYRIRRLEELGGWSLADPELRLALQVAVRIVQSDQFVSDNGD